MKERTGRDIFLQHVERIYADKAPSFYFINMSTQYNRFIGDIISDVMNELTRHFRGSLGMLSKDVQESIFGDDVWRSKGFRVNFQPTDKYGPTPKDVTGLIKELGSKSSLPKDRYLLVYSTTNDAFISSNGRRSSFGSSVLDYGVLDQLDTEVAEAKSHIEQVRINLISSYNSMEPRFSSDCSVVVSSIDNIPYITLFGTKDDEVYTFAYRDGTYEPLSISQIIKPYERIEHIKASEEKRAYFFNQYSEHDINPFVAYSHNISISAYYYFPTYVEEFTLLDAANTPFDELLKLAANVENGLTVFCNSQSNLKSDDIVEEAGLAWREGKYVSLTDSIQPGFSRNGTFMYKSEKLKDLAVVSYNLLLEKERS